MTVTDISREPQKSEVIRLAAYRIWYEADINYYSGYRNGHRILWSNDALLFVS